MPDVNTNVQPGDWIQISQLFPGIWKVSRVLSGFKEHRWSLNEPSVISLRTVVFCHRIVNDSWKRSFAFQCCELSYVSKLTLEDLVHLEALLVADTKLSKAFDKYKDSCKTLGSIANLAFGGFSDQEVTQFSDKCDEMLASRIDNGVTLDEVLACISHRRIVYLGEFGSGNSWKGRHFCVITTLSKRGSGCGKGGLSYDRV